jgi:hypothetical protein
MNTAIDKLVAALTVRVKEIDSGNPLGTGVLYYSPELRNRAYVFTAAHVLYKDGDEFAAPYVSMFIDVYNPLTKRYETLQCPINSNLVNSDIDNDIAIIVLEKEKVELITGPLPSIECLQERHSITSYIVKGFPEATRREELATIHPVWKQTMTGVDKFQLEMKEDYQEWSMNGFSGSGAFLHVNDKVYLFGIFTRYREEGRGKIIYCQYLHALNHLLSRNFLPEISFAYLGEHGLIRSFFEDQVSFAVKNLGPRFNEKLNFRLPIAQLFHDLAKDNIFKQGLLNLLDHWLIARNFSYHKTDTGLLEEIEAVYEKARKELVAYISNIGWQADQRIELDGFEKQIRAMIVQLREKLWELFELQRDQRDQQPPEIKENPAYQPPYQNEISRVREIERNNYDVLEALETRNVTLSNHPCLLIQGEAGCGKSHLLGDIATQRMKEGRPTILLLGQLFKSREDCWKQLLEQLHLNCKKEEFLGSLNSIGQQTGSRALILIDALNEGAGKELWPDQLAGFIEEISRYPFIGLALTIRSSYFRAVIPDAVVNNPAVLRITHQGFKGNEYEALRLFCEHHDLQQPNFPILAPEFTNPLFLQLICEGVKVSNEKVFPQGFQGVSSTFNYYLKSVASKLAAKREEYWLKPKLARQAIEEMARAMHAKKDVKSVTLEEAVNLFENKFPAHRFLLSDLIHENVFIQSTYEHYDTKIQEEVIYFAYERFGDFFIAEELLQPFNSAEEVIEAFKEGKSLGDLLETAFWKNNGLMEAFAVLLPEKFNLEIVEVYDWAFSGNHEQLLGNIDDWLGHYLLDSLKWRKIQSIENKKITKWINSEHCQVDPHTFYNRILELTTIKDHPFNSDRFTDNLLSDPLPVRDSIWQEFFRYYSGFDDQRNAYPLRRLIDWAWQPGISTKIDTETVRLTAQTLCWVLSSTYRRLRDETTKALVNLLEEQPEALITILKKFETIDDPYIAERLYAVAYGCALRTRSIHSLSKIAQYVYDHIFSQSSPPLHILLRDYARNIVEYAVYKQAPVIVDIELISPPYNSRMPENYPSDEDMKAFELDHNSDYYKQNNGRLFNFIKFDTLSWDFGDKTIESAFREFCPVSFTMEEEYRIFLKGLKRNQRAQVRYLEQAYKLKAIIEKKKVYRYSEINQNILDSVEAATDNQLQEMPGELEKLLSPEQFAYFIKRIQPHFSNIARMQKGNRDAIDTEPLKRWIVQRAHGLGYQVELHTRYDDSVERYSHRGEDTIERIGKKYQRIALHEMAAMVSDNYKIRIDDDHGKKYEFYQGPWQRYLRDVNPSFVTRNKVLESGENESDNDLSDKWWWDSSYRYWNGADTVWVSNLHDLTDPSFIIQRTDPDGIDWLYLRTNMSWHEPKPIGEDRYEVRRKEVWYLLQGYLVKKKDKTRIFDRLKKDNFKGRNLLETHHANLGLINRENYWSPASNTNQSEKWRNFDESKNKVMVATSEAVGELSEDKSGAHNRYEMPCKMIFEGMGLTYAANDGDFVDSEGKLIATTTERNGVLIKKKKFLKYLEANELDIIWALLGEKRVVGGYHTWPDNLFTTISGAYAFENGKIVGEFSKSTDDN